MKTMKTIGMMIIGMTFIGTTTTFGKTNVTVSTSSRNGVRTELRVTGHSDRHVSHGTTCCSHRHDCRPGTFDMRRHMLEGNHRYNRYNICVVCDKSKKEIRRYEREMRHNCRGSHYGR